MHPEHKPEKIQLSLYFRNASRAQTPTNSDSPIPSLLMGQNNDQSPAVRNHLKQGNLLKGVDKKIVNDRDFEGCLRCLFTNMFIKNFFIRKQNDSTLQSFIYNIFPKNHFLNGDHIATANIVFKS